MKWIASAHSSQKRRRGTGASDSFFSFKVFHPNMDKAQLYFAYEL